MAEYKITAQNFESEVLSSNVPVLIDFWASWCGPCRMLAPTIAELSEELDGKVKVGKVNVDEEGALAMRFGVNTIPTVILFENGAEKSRLVGYRPKEDFLSML